MAGPTSALQDCGNIARCLTPYPISQETHGKLQNHYRNQYIVRSLLLLPEGIYRHALIVLNAILCVASQAVRLRPAIRITKYWVNSNVIALAKGSIDTSVYQLGWGSPRVGLLLSSITQLWARAVRSQNLRRYNSSGYPDVESGAFPIDPVALAAAACHRILRVTLYFEIAMGAILVAIADRTVPDSCRRRIDRFLDNTGRLLRNKLEVPASELRIMGPGFTQRGLQATAGGLQWVMQHKYIKQLSYKALGLG